MINGTDGRAHHHVRRSYGAHAGPFCPVRLLRKWLDVAGITEGALFRQPKGGKRVGGRITGKTYYDLVKQAIAPIGIDASNRTRCGRAGPRPLPRTAPSSRG